jgi:flagellar hook-length control protein FliK
MGLVALPPAAAPPGHLSLPRERPGPHAESDFAARLRDRAEPESPESGPELRGWRRADHPGQGHAYGRAVKTEPNTDESAPPDAEAEPSEEAASAAGLLAVPTHLPVLPNLPDSEIPVATAEASTPAPIPIAAPDATVAGPLTAGATQSSDPGATSEPQPVSLAPESSAPANTVPEPAVDVAVAAAETSMAPSSPEAATPPVEAEIEEQSPALTTNELPPSPAADETGPVGPPEESPEAALLTPTVETSNAAHHDASPDSKGAETRPGLAVERPLPKASPKGVAHAADASAVAQLREPLSSDAAPAVEPPAAQAPADLPEPVQQVSQVVVEAIEQGGGEARLHLKPAELGEVVIRLQIDGTDVRLQVQAERPEAMQLLREHRLDLTNLLGDRGLDLSELYVGLGGRDSSSADGRGESAPANQRRGESEFAGLLGLDPDSSIANHQRLRAAYNPDGAHVYRI